MLHLDNRCRSRIIDLNVIEIYILIFWLDLISCFNIWNTQIWFIILKITSKRSCRSLHFFIQNLSLMMQSFRGNLPRTRRIISIQLVKYHRLRFIILLRFVLFILIVNQAIIWIIFSKKNAFFLDESNVFLCVSDFFQFIFVLLTINMVFRKARSEKRKIIVPRTTFDFELDAAMS